MKGEQGFGDSITASIDCPATAGRSRQAQLLGIISGLRAKCVAQVPKLRQSVNSINIGPAHVLRLLYGLDNRANPAGCTRTIKAERCTSNRYRESHHGPGTNIGQTSTLAVDGFAYECEIQAESLSTLLAADLLNKVRIIKVDVEGAEWDVVQGMHGLLAAADERVEIVIEISAAAAHDEEP